MGRGIPLLTGGTGSVEGSVQWRGERYDGTSSRTRPFRPKKNKNNKFERYDQRTNKNIANYTGGLVLWAADACFRATFAQPGPVSSISLGRFF